MLTWKEIRRLRTDNGFEFCEAGYNEFCKKLRDCQTSHYC